MSQVGVVVARFQVPYLHAGHIHLLNQVWERSDRLLIVLGSPSIPNERNILPYDLRVEMVKDFYPFAHFAEILDHHEDKDWSGSLDKLIQVYLGIVDVGSKATLYGSRDCFSKFYTGNYPFVELPELRHFSGTDMRDKLQPVNNANYRLGMIHGFNLKKSEVTNEKSCKCSDRKSGEYPLSNSYEVVHQRENK